MNLNVSQLTYPPLIEAIFELRWGLQIKHDKILIDPHYKILPGKLSSCLEKQYPYYESLPTIEMPDEIAAYTIQHRFRVGKDKWPLIQLGPGIVTLNDVKDYYWDDFYHRIDNLLKALFYAYPDSSNLKFGDVVLRYIDAYSFDYINQNIVNFLNQKLKISTILPIDLLKECEIEDKPIGMDQKFSFIIKKPQGVLHIRFARGEYQYANSIIWETIVQLNGEDTPNSKEDILKWVNDAHILTHKWFFKIIDGDLLEEFK